MQRKKSRYGSDIYVEDHFDEEIMEKMIYLEQQRMHDEHEIRTLKQKLEQSTRMLNILQEQVMINI